MVKLLIIFCLITNFISKTYSDCLFNKYEEFASPIFTRSYEGYDILAEFEGSTINIEEGQYLNLHCPSDLRDVLRKKQNLTWIGIQCINQEIQYSDNENIYNTIVNRDYYDDYGTYHSQNEPTFRCDNNRARFFKHSNSLCVHGGYLYGYKFSFSKPINIILAEFCYDFKSFDTVYVHYVAGYQSSALQKLVELNPGGKTYTNITPVASLPGLNKTKIYPGFFTNEHYYAIRDYEIGELVPFGSIAPDFKKYLANEAANRIVWWSPLKYGNWDIYSQSLQETSLESTFEVFAGKSGQIKYPHKDCDLDMKLIYKDGKKQKFGPLYIWNYIIPRNDYNNSFVVIGINSPFLELKSRDNGTIFCNDICDEIDWLKPLKRTRRMPAMGYIFCCNPDEVQNMLLGFPQVHYPFVENTIQSLPESKYPYENDYNYSPDF